MFATLVWWYLTELFYVFSLAIFRMSRAGYSQFNVECVIYITMAFSWPFAKIASSGLGLLQQAHLRQQFYFNGADVMIAEINCDPDTRDGR